MAYFLQNLDFQFFNYFKSLPKTKVQLSSNKVYLVVNIIMTLSLSVSLAALDQILIV